MKEKYVKISYPLFVALCRYHLGGSDADELTIRNGLARKMKSMDNHNLYTKIQNAANDREREEAARRYREAISR